MSKIIKIGQLVLNL